MSEYRFELRQGRSQKFWETWITGKTLHTRWGRIGSKGQAKKTAFPEKEKAILALNRLIDQKVKKGYQRVWDAAPAAPPKVAKGRSHASEKDVVARLAKTPPAWRKIALRSRYLLEENGAEVHDGDLSCDALRVGPRPLVVTGNLRVRGLLSDGHKADETLLLVLGNLDAKNVLTYGAIHVAGNVRVREVLYGASAHDRLFLCGGSFAARAFVDGDHWVQVLGKLALDTLVGACLLAKKGKPKRTLRADEALVKKAYSIDETDEDGSVTSSSPRRDVVPRLLQSGKRVLA